MPKDATKNVDRYKIRGGHLNAFEFHQNQGAVSQQPENGGLLSGPADETGLPPDKAKAARTRKLLAEHGETVPEPTEGNTMNTEQTAERDEQEGEDFGPTHGRDPEVIRQMIQSRRATDEVPDPEDIASGNRENSPQKKEHGITGERTGSRSAAVRQRGGGRESQAANRPAAEPAKGTRTTGDAAGSGGKRAALRNSANAVIKGETDKSGGRKAAVQKESKQTSNRASSQRGGSQEKTNETGKESRARNSANQKPASARKSADKKTAQTGTGTGNTGKTGKASAAETRTSAAAQARTAGRKSR